MSYPQPNPVLNLSRNCWRLAEAENVAVIVDAEDYFRAVKRAMLEARHHIYLLGWDFDARTTFEAGTPTLEGPNQLGKFLRWLAKSRPELNIHILKWDLGLLLEAARGTVPLAIVCWPSRRQIHFKLDTAHPKTAAQHQKIVVVDDAIAFCGGIDITLERWDTRGHLDGDERRKRPNGSLYEPWHDATTMVDGEVARAFGDLARDRWRVVTGETLTPSPGTGSYWPQGVEPDFCRLTVGISRTIPRYGTIDEVREIEALYLDAIAAARKTIYCESQYFASRRIAEAFAQRLDEPDGPEIVVINPLSADGYLEAAVMDSARARLLGLVSKARYADRRFRIFTPVTASGSPIYVHAKIMIVDDRLLRVGSSNFNNRSLGFDVECDLVVDVGLIPAASKGNVCAKIAALRTRLLAEHLELAQESVDTAIEAHGSLIALIESVSAEGRTLVRYHPDEPSLAEEVLEASDLLDPEGAPDYRKRAVIQFTKRALR